MLIPPSVLVTIRSGWAATGVVSLALLLAEIGSTPLLPSSPMLAVLLLWVAPARRGVSTVTAKVGLAAPAPPTTLSIVSVQVLLALLCGLQLQPTLLAPALKPLLSGTVSVNTTPGAAITPELV